MRHPAHRNNWIRGWRRDIAGIERPDVRAAGFALCDAMVAWNGGEGPRPAVELIRASLQLGSRAVNAAATEALGLLLADHPDPAAMLAEVFQAVPAEARARLVQFMPWPPGIGRDAKVEFLRAALHDRSSLVRFHAVSTVASARLAELAPIIDELIARETDVSTRDFQVECAALARVGYWVESEDTSGVRLVVQADDHRRSLTVPRHIVDRFGIEAVAEMVRRHKVGPYPWEEDDADSAV